jgi:hypothetical protein
MDKNMNIRKSIAFIILLNLANFAFSAEKADTVRFSAPVLITPAGQSADGLMLKILCQKAGVDFIYSNLADTDSLIAWTAVPKDTLSPKPIKTVILVPGGSTKGLGAAKIDEKQEIVRVNALIRMAQERKIPILLCHLGGITRRGSLSDEFNRIAAEAADALVVVKGGNDDGFFTAIAQKRKAPIYQVENIIDVTGILKQLFGKE